MNLDGFNSRNAEREEVGEHPFANPRNAASGSMKMQDPTEVALRPLDCFFYYIPGNQLEIPTHYDSLRLASKMGLKISKNIAVCRNTNEIFEFINDWAEGRKHLNYEIDGAFVTDEYRVANMKWTEAFREELVLIYPPGNQSR